MPLSNPRSGAEERFEAELAADVLLRRTLSAGSWAVSLSTVATLLTLIIPLHRTSPWLIVLSLFAISTRLSFIVAWKALLIPRFFLSLDDADPETAAAARAVFERHRRTLLAAIYRDGLIPADASAIASLGPEEAANIARRYDVQRRRRLGRCWFVAWCVVFAVIFGVLIATGGGPTE